MIRPTKHSHPDKTVIYASFIMLKELRKKRVVSYSDLFQLIKNKVTSGEFLFMPSLNFLFLLGLVEYKVKTDSIEYIEKS